MIVRWRHWGVVDIVHLTYCLPAIETNTVAETSANGDRGAEAPNRLGSTDQNHRKCNVLPFEASIIIPANNEEAVIGACLAAILSQDENAGRLQILVAANACTDRTVEIVHSFADAASARGWKLVCQNDQTAGKVAALNRADALVQSSVRVYLDADVVCSPDLIGKLRTALSSPEPAFATGKLVVARARSWVTSVYGRFWAELPFVTDGATGAGLYAVNEAGRRRWGSFPSIISDDTFVRLSFSPVERTQVEAEYFWPMVEGLRNLVRVRSRQDAGVQEVYEHYPELRTNENKTPVRLADLARIAFRDVTGFLVYGVVALLVKLRPNGKKWARGR